MTIGLVAHSAFFLSVIAFSIAIASFAKNPKNRLFLSFSVLCVVVSGYGFSFYLEKYLQSQLFHHVHLTFNLLLAPAGLMFMRELTQDNSYFRKTLILSCLILTPVFILLLWTKQYSSNLILILILSWPHFLTIECLRVLFQFLFRIVKNPNLNKNYLEQKSKKGEGWLYGGGILLLLTAAMDHVPFLGEVIPVIGNGFVCLYLYIVHEVIILQRLLNVSVLLNRVMALVFLSSCFTFVYAVMVLWVERSPALFVMNSFLASMIILNLVEPIKKFSNWTAVRFFLNKTIQIEKKVKAAEKNLVGVFDAFTLAKSSISFIDDVFAASQVSVFILRSDGSKFRRIAGKNDKELKVQEILSNHNFIQFFNWMLKHGDNPIILSQFVEIERNRSTSEIQKKLLTEVLEMLRALSANIAIPFLVTEGNQTNTLGFVAFFAKQPPPPWHDDWGSLVLVYPFFEKSAQILKNLEIFIQLREKERLATLGEMSAGLAHEIRNPLGAIKGAAQMLQSNSNLANPKEAPFLEVIIEEVDRLNKVVTQFLDYSRPLDSAEKKFILVSNLFERVKDFFNSEKILNQKYNNIDLDFVPPSEGFEGLPKLLCIPEQIKQVMVNLLQNSINSFSEISENSHKRIKIGAYAITRRTIERDSTNRAEIAIYVEDNGAGILNENLEKIFVPFFTEKKSGTGLGLSISARIIEAHGGVIDVFSEPNVTTRFTVTLPFGSQS